MLMAIYLYLYLSVYLSSYLSVYLAMLGYPCQGCNLIDTTRGYVYPQGWPPFWTATLRSRTGWREMGAQVSFCSSLVSGGYIHMHTHTLKALGVASQPPCLRLPPATTAGELATKGTWPSSGKPGVRERGVYKRALHPSPLR